jgi:hypothetical protein
VGKCSSEDEQRCKTGEFEHDVSPVIELVFLERLLKIAGFWEAAAAADAGGGG